METFADVWQAIDEGKKVYWKNKGYQVIVETVLPCHKPENVSMGQALSIRYTQNWFGGFMVSSEIPDLFTE